MYIENINHSKIKNIHDITKLYQQPSTFLKPVLVFPGPKIVEGFQFASSLENQ